MTKEQQQIFERIQNIQSSRPQYRVTRQFISGTLKGLHYTEITSVEFEVGFICNKPCAGDSGYQITSVEKVK